MKKLLLPIVFVFLATLANYAQKATIAKGSEICSSKKASGKNLAVKSFRSENSPKHAFDVLNYTINLDLVNCSSKTGTMDTPDNIFSKILVELKKHGIK